MEERTFRNFLWQPFIYLVKNNAIAPTDMFWSNLYYITKIKAFDMGRVDQKIDQDLSLFEAISKDICKI